MRKMLFFLATAMMIFMASCSKSDDSFNEEPITPKEDSVVFIVTTNILTPWKAEYLTEKNSVGVWWVDNGSNRVYEFAPGIRKVLKGEEARAIIGKEVTICSWVEIYRMWSSTLPSPIFTTTYSPAPVSVVIEKNKTYTYHFDVTFTPV